MDAVVMRAGISFKFGKSYASSSANKMSALNDDTFNSYQLSEAQREVDGLRNKVASLESFKAAEVADKAAEVAEMKSLKAEIAEMKLMMAGLLGNRVVAMR
jgi:peptidoglycan hydrolase CwlO-like protein